MSPPEGISHLASRMVLATRFLLSSLAELACEVVESATHSSESLT